MNIFHVQYGELISCGSRRLTTTTQGVVLGYWDYLLLWEELFVALSQLDYSRFSVHLSQTKSHTGTFLDAVNKCSCRMGALDSYCPNACSTMMTAWWLDIVMELC